MSSTSTDRDSGPRRLGSVIIPAHNESAVIRRCLDALFDGLDPASVDVVVACNGCTDDTAELARSSAYPITVLETEVPSKTVALRLAEKTVSSFPRIYLDADVVLRGAAATTLLARLDADDALAGRPPIQYDISRSSWPVRCYYRARMRVPAVMNSLWGAGVYGLSSLGRGRFGEYPDVVAEDLYIDSLFTPGEIEIVQAEPVSVKVPRSVGPLLNILRRTYRGNSQHAKAARDSDRSTTPTASGSVAKEVIRSGARGVGPAIDAIMYLALAVVARLLVAVGPSTRWERDDSSREE